MSVCVDAERALYYSHRLVGSEHFHIHISQVYPGFYSASGIQFKTLCGPPTAGFWSIWHGSPCTPSAHSLAPELLNPNLTVQLKSLFFMSAWLHNFMIMIMFYKLPPGSQYNEHGSPASWQLSLSHLITTSDLIYLIRTHTRTHTRTLKCDLWFEFCPQVLHLFSTSMQAVCLYLGLPGCLTATTAAVIVGRATTFTNSTKVLCCLHVKSLIGDGSQGSGSGSGSMTMTILVCFSLYAIWYITNGHQVAVLLKERYPSFHLRKLFFLPLTKLWE